MIRRASALWQRWIGIRLRFHPLFSILMLLSAATGYFVEMLTLFGVVFIHELGHVTAARGLGWRIKEIQLLPFGGVAVVEEQASTPLWQEMIVVLAGPLQNLWMLALGMGLMEIGWLPQEWGVYFVQANLMIALFNLLPVLPLDGGKLMHALISLWLPFQKATLLALGISLLFSVTMVAAALLLPLASEDGRIQLNWLLIGLFLIAANWSDWHNFPYTFMRFMMNREQVLERLADKGVLAQPIVVSGHHKVADIAKLLLRERFHLVFILDKRQKINRVMSEKRLVEHYFDNEQRSLPVSELLP